MDSTTEGADQQRIRAAECIKQWLDDVVNVRRSQHQA